MEGSREVSPNSRVASAETADAADPGSHNEVGIYFELDDIAGQIGTF